MTSLPRPLQIAISQIGTFEYSGRLTNPHVAKYLTSVGLPGIDSIPWCAAFVNWCLQEGGVKGTNSGLARSFLYWGNNTDDPKPGDIVVLRRGVDPRKGHVGFYLDKSNGYIRLLGGNQGDRVGVNSYAAIRLLGYRRVV
jgi:uncharacterized protein (TIGR02594 family)